MATSFVALHIRPKWSNDRWGWSFWAIKYATTVGTISAFRRMVSAREAILISVGSEGCWEGHGNTNGGLRVIER